MAERPHLLEHRISFVIEFVVPIIAAFPPRSPSTIFVSFPCPSVIIGEKFLESNPRIEVWNEEKETLLTQYRKNLAFYYGYNKFKEPAKRFVPWLLDLNNVESRLSYGGIKRWRGGEEAEEFHF